MASYQVDNARKFKRAQAHSLVKYQTAEKWSAEEPYISNVKDISAGGLRFWSGVFFPENSLLRISVWAPFLQRPVDALARVVRSRATKTAGSYYLSVRFIEVDETLQNALNGFIENLAANPKTRRFIDDFQRSTRRTRTLGRI